MYPTVSYSNEDKADKLTITAKVALPAFNKFVLKGILVFIPLLILFFLWIMFFVGAENPPPAGFNIFMWVMIGILVAFMYFSYKGIKRTSDFKIQVNKQSREFISAFDKFSINAKEIRKIEIAEVTPALGLGKIMPTLKFITNTGEKTLNFPFDSYNKAKEIKEIIEKALGK